MNELNKVNVDGILYDLPSGGSPEYVHYLKVNAMDTCGETSEELIIVTSSSNAQMTLADLKTLLSSGYEIDSDYGYKALSTCLYINKHNSYVAYSQSLVAYDPSGDSFCLGEFDSSNAVTIESVISDTIVENGTSGGSGSGSGNPRYIHYIEAEFTDGCDETHTGVIILENGTSTQLSVSDFKALFTKQDSSESKYLIPAVTSQYYKTYSYGLAPCLFTYGGIEDDGFYAQTENNTDSLSLSSITDTVIPNGVSGGGGSSEAPTFYLHRLELTLLDGCDEEYKVYISYINTLYYAISSLTDLKNFVFNKSIGGGKIISTDKPGNQFFVKVDDNNPKAIPCCLILNSNDTFGDIMASNVFSYSSELTLQSVSDYVVAYE